MRLAGILERYGPSRRPGGAIVAAVGTTAVVTVAASAYGVSTGRDLTNLGGILTLGLFALLGALIVGLFVHLAAFQLAVAVIGALLFTGFITLDTQRVARTAAASQGDAILLAVSIYLGIVNLFPFLLQIFRLGQSNRDWCQMTGQAVAGTKSATTCNEGARKRRNETHSTRSLQPPRASRRTTGAAEGDSPSAGRLAGLARRMQARVKWQRRKEGLTDGVRARAILKLSLRQARSLFSQQRAIDPSGMTTR